MKSRKKSKNRKKYRNKKKNMKKNKKKRTRTNKNRMMRRGIQFKLVLIIIFVSLILFSAVLFYQFRAEKSVFEENYISRAEAVIYSLDASIETRDKLHDKQGLFLTLTKNIWLDSDILAVHVFHFDDETDTLELFISSDQTFEEEDMDANNLEAYNQDSFVTKIFYRDDFRVLRIMAPIHASGQKTGTFQVEFSLERVDKELASALWRLILSSLIISVVFVVVVVLFVRRAIIKPLQKVSRAAESIARGNLDVRVKVKSGDELEDLATSFNRMAADLKDSHNKIRAHEKELEKRVEQRTEELNKKVSELEDTRSAILNMLEDVNLSKEALEKSEKELKKLNKELRRANEELKRMDEYKNQFISVTAHELKTPLASIHGFASLLQSKKIMSDPKQRKYYLEIVMKDADRLKKLIDDIMDLSRLDLGTMKFVFEKVNIKDLLKGVLRETYMIAAEKGISLKAKVGKQVPDDIIIDRDRTIQVLINLVTNAIKYTPEKKKDARITISASRKGKSGKSGKYVQFSVSDKGVGIKKKYLKKIFNRFYQVDSSYTRKVGGTGLGLSISKGIIEAMDGRMWVKSQVNKGTTFYFTLPVKSKKSSGKRLNVFEDSEKKVVKRSKKTSRKVRSKKRESEKSN